jgi:hypothetical protein
MDTSESDHVEIEMRFCETEDYIAFLPTNCEI